MIIRDYRPADFTQVEALWKETGIYTLERGDTNKIILRCNARGGKFLILEDSETTRVTGTSWLTYDGRRVFLHHFAISPLMQGKGLGRILALASLEFAHELRSPLKLEVHRENISAINLYKSLGFNVFEDYELFMIMDPGKPLQPETQKGLDPPQ